MDSSRLFHLDQSLPDSSCLQVLEQLKQHLHLGTLRSGDRLPSVRSLAEILDVNPKTAHSIYHFLEYEGLVEIRPKSGVFVCGGSLVERQSSKADLAIKVRRLIREARSLGFSQDELWSLLEGCFGAKSAPQTIGVVECNQEFCDLICEDLADDLRLDVVAFSMKDLAEQTSGQLELVRFLVTTEYHLDEVRGLVRDLGKEVYGIRLNCGFFEDLESQLEKGQVLFLGREKTFLDELKALLNTVLASQDSDKFITLTYDNQFLVRRSLQRVQSVYLSSTCPSTVKEWIEENKPAEVSIREPAQIVSAKSLKELKNVLFFSGGMVTRGPVSRYAFG